MRGVPGIQEKNVHFVEELVIGEQEDLKKNLFLDENN